MQYIIFILIAQAAYSVGDVVRKLVMHNQPFGLNLFSSAPFVFSFIITIAAFILQLYVLKNYDLSKTIVVLACAGIVFSVILGMIVFNEKVTALGWVGVVFAVLAVVFTHIG
jgi:multidrug transporter EmrE-like cation transporter